MYISVVIPCYGCKAAIKELCNRLLITLESITNSYEIILVDDACPQNSWEEIVSICTESSKIKGVKLSRNFGQINAITAGLESSCGDWVVVMDCDLQDRPEYIVDMLHKAKDEGLDVVFARRNNRKDSRITKLFSRMFYRVYGYFTDGNYDPSICNFSISKRRVIEQYCKMSEHNRAYTIFIKWLGFKQGTIDIESDARFEGKSSYSFKKKLKMASNIILAQSTKPLKISIIIGMATSLLAFIAIIYLIIAYFLNPGHTTIGWTSIIATQLLMGGLVLISIGIVGLYIGNIFDEVKNRQIYIIDKKINYNED